MPARNVEGRMVMRSRFSVICVMGGCILAALTTCQIGRWMILSTSVPFVWESEMQPGQRLPRFYCSPLFIVFLCAP